MTLGSSYQLGQDKDNGIKNKQLKIVCMLWLKQKNITHFPCWKIVFQFIIIGQKFCFTKKLLILLLLYDSKCTRINIEDAQMLLVLLYIQEKLRTKKKCKTFIIRISNQELKEDLIIFEMLGYDVTLDMNFLSTYHVIIDCFKRKVKFYTPKRDVVFFLGGKRILFPSFSVKHCFQLVKEKSGHNFFCKFSIPNVFLEELPRLPFKRECNFTIGAYSYTTPI